jgi:hypothetical protein
MRHDYDHGEPSFRCCQRRKEDGGYTVIADCKNFTGDFRITLILLPSTHAIAASASKYLKSSASIKVTRLRLPSLTSRAVESKERECLL